MSPKYVVTRFGVLLAHSLRCGFMIQRPKSQQFYFFFFLFFFLLQEKKKLCTLFSSLKQWPKFVFEAVGGKLLESSGCIAMLILKH